MSQAGVIRRMRRIFKEDGRAVIVAMDHGSFMDKPLPGLDDAAATIRKAAAGGADAFLVPVGTAVAAIEAFGDAGVILSVNSASPALEKQVETALAIGADGIKCMLYPFAARPGEDLAGAVGFLAAEARRAGLPFMVEPIPGGWAAGPDMRTAEAVAAGARVAAELGATMVKTFYPGTPAGMRTVAGNTPVPVLVLGGEEAGRALVDPDVQPQPPLGVRGVQGERQRRVAGAGAEHGVGDAAADQLVDDQPGPGRRLVHGREPTWR